MKTISAGLRTHLDQTVTTLATLWKLTRRDGVEFFFTDHDEDIIFGGDTYKARTGYNRTAIQNDSSMAVDNLDLEGLFDSADIQEDELRAGLFDFAEVRVSLVNWSDLTQGELKLRRGILGEVVLTQQGIFRAELRGMTQFLSQNVLEVYQPECRADLGDARCGIPIYPAVLGRNQAVVVGEFYRVPTDGMASGQAQYENRVYEVTVAGTTAGVQPVYDETIGNTTVDGTATLTARDAFMRHATVATVTSRRVFTITVTEARAVDDWFNGGGLTFETGDNAGRTLEIKDWVQGTSTVTLYIPAPYTIQVGDTLRLYAGCDKRRETCRDKFDNVPNFRGEPFIPGTDDLVRYPDAR